MKPRLLTRGLAVVAALASGSLGLSAAGASSPDPLPAAAYGTTIPELGSFESARVERDAWAYAAAQGGTADQQLATAQKFAAGEAAYVYGLPLIDLHDTLRSVMKVPNEVISVDALADPSSTAVVTPNNDTVYSSAWIDLTKGPLVFDVPDTGGRFYTVQLMDGWTNAYSYVGSGTTGTGAGSFVIVPPGYSGALPSGVPVIHSPTYTNWLLGRTLVKDTADLQTVRPTLQKYVLTPLAAWQLGVRGQSLVVNSQMARAKPTPPSGADFIATLNQELRIDPPADPSVLAALAPAGVQAPAGTASDALAAATENLLADPTASQPDPVLTAATTAGQALIADAEAQLKAGNTADYGWSPAYSWLGRYGTLYLPRAIVAMYFLGANTPEQATYPMTYVDLKGRPLSGDHAYTITFPKGDLPPVKAFWSLTLYNQDDFLVANSLNRYSIGDRTPGLVYGADGSLTIHLQHAVPTSAAARADWLPTPTDAFHLVLRLYEPSKAALDGTWRVPPVLRDDELLRPTIAQVRTNREQGRRVRLTWRTDEPATTVWRVYRNGHLVRRIRHQDHAGVNTLLIRLRPGRYRLVGVPTAPHSVGPGRAVTVRFRSR